MNRELRSPGCHNPNQLRTAVSNWISQKCITSSLQRWAIPQLCSKIIRTYMAMGLFRMRTNLFNTPVNHKTCQMLKCRSHSKILQIATISPSTLKMFSPTDRTRHLRSTLRCSRSKQTSLHHLQNRCKLINFYLPNRNIQLICSNSNSLKRNLIKWAIRMSVASKASPPPQRLSILETKCTEDGRKACRLMFHRWTLKISNKA